MPAVAKIRSILENHSTLRNGRHVMSYVQLARSRQICREHYGDLYDICFWPRVFVAFPAIAAPPVMVIETRFLIKYIEEFERILQTVMSSLAYVLCWTHEMVVSEERTERPGEEWQIDIGFAHRFRNAQAQAFLRTRSNEWLGSQGSLSSRFSQIRVLS